MEMGEVIRRHRKAQNLTQEELAKLLGVTAPAVNKWEKGNTMPDVALLVPIARTLNVSLNELLAYQESLSDEEIQGILCEAEQKMKEELPQEALLWMKKQIEDHPSCDRLVYSLAVLIDGFVLFQQENERLREDENVIHWLDGVLQSDDPQLRILAAEALYNIYLRRDEIEKARACLEAFSEQNPEKKRKKAQLFERTGEYEKASRIYEEILLTDYQILSMIFQGLFAMQMKENHLEKAKYYAGKKKALAQLFEMGTYHEETADLEWIQAERDLDRTLELAQHMLKHVNSLQDFTHAPLYAHMTFKPDDGTLAQMVRRDLYTLFFSGDEFSYMQDDPRWNALRAEAEED